MRIDRRRFIAAGAAAAGASLLPPPAWRMAAASGAGAASGADEGWRPLFNGRDLAGWVNVNGARSTWSVRDGVIVCTGRPICVLRTDRMYENFILELEWRHIHPGGNAGLFVWSDALTARGQPFTRAVEVQILDGHNSQVATSHGDVFAIHGAVMTPDRPHPDGWMRCLPSERRARPSPQWNHYRVACEDGAIKLAVNGKVVSGGYDVSPRKGYICLESEGSEVHFRHIRIRDLPSTDAGPAQTARPARGFENLYNGLDFSGWRITPEHRDHWRSEDWRLIADGRGPALWTERAFGDAEIIIDWRWSADARPSAAPDDARAGRLPMPVGGLAVRGGERNLIEAAPDAEPGRWQRYIVRLHGDRIAVEHNGEHRFDRALAEPNPRGPIGLIAEGGGMEFANIYVMERK